MEELYWITRLDSIIDFAKFFTFISGIIILGCIFCKALKVYLYTITKEKELRRVRKEIHDYIHERCDTL